MKGLDSGRRRRAAAWRRAWLIGLAAAVAAGLSACGQPPLPDFTEPLPPGKQWVALPAGTTPLASIGLYRVAYQRYDEPVVHLPVSWTGDFTEDAGVAFYAARHGGKPAMMLHCPWKRKSGAASVEYRLALPASPAGGPQARPILLKLAIAMRPDVVEGSPPRSIAGGEPGKSDGVTFSAQITCDDKPLELFREHYAAAEPKPLEFDLSEYAGKNVVLRLQTEPGPDRNAGFDFSYFIEPRIVVGAPSNEAARLVAEMTATRAYRTLRRADLKPLINRPDAGIVPSCKVRFRNRVRARDGAAEFTYDGPDCRIVYHYKPGTGTLDDLLVGVDGGRGFRPCSRGGVRLAAGPDDGPLQQAELVSFETTAQGAAATWKYTRGSVSATVNWKFRIAGKALVIEADSPDATIASFSLGRPLADFRKRIPIPYLYPRAADFLAGRKLFCLAWLDWTQSHASRSPGSEAVYVPKLDGKRNPLRESGYVAVSPDLDEVLPNIPHPPSPYLRTLAPKMMLDVWGGRFADIASMLEDYESYGIDEMAVIIHNWQRYGYDVKLPDHLPANPDLGGDKGMKLLGDTAKRLGYLFSLHENYIDFYPDAPSWNPKDVVLSARGERQKAWYHPGTKVQSFAVKSGRMLHYAKQNSPEIHRRFGTTAAYLDVHTCTPPWHYVDYQSDVPMAAMHAAKGKHHPALFQYERDVHGGPLFGEGHNHFYWAGLVDGVEAQVRGGEDHDVLVDFDLLKLHPQMVNHGMGYYSRWLRTGRASRHGIDWPTPAQMDKYRAQELAYGHASFIGSGTRNVMSHVVREYNLCQPIQARCGGAKVTEISYEVGGRFVSSSVAAAAGVLDRLRIRYDSGLRLHVNLRDEDWKVGRYVLPQYGFLAESLGLLAYTARKDGLIVDYARTRRSLYVDSRTDVYRPWSSGYKDVEPRLKRFSDLGEGKFQITYEWVIGETAPPDLHCFVHFDAPGKPRATEAIVFQNDHAPPIPTAEWKPPKVLTDGPHTVEVPEDAKADRFNILIGLYNKKIGRVRLKGLQFSQDRILIGRLGVTRKDGRIEKLRLEDLAAVREEFRRKREPFVARMNVQGRKVDFGAAATDGAFKIRIHKEYLELFPYPRDRKFQIELNLVRLVGGSRVSQAAVTALDRAGERLADVASDLAGNILTFQAGLPGAARYRIECR